MGEQPVPAAPQVHALRRPPSPTNNRHAFLDSLCSYIRNLPRPVEHIFLPSGGRAEVLVRCPRPGVYTLTAGRDPSPFGEPLNTNANSFKQGVVMTLVVTPGRPRAAHLAPCWQPLVPRACRPRFPGYAADLSDANLARVGALDKISLQAAGFTSPMGVSVEGMHAGAGGWGVCSPCMPLHVQAWPHRLPPPRSPPA